MPITVISGAKLSLTTKLFKSIIFKKADEEVLTSLKSTEKKNNTTHFFLENKCLY